MKILINKQFEDFKDLYSSEGKISFTNGNKLSINEKGYYIVPGFIDQHIHGAGGSDFMDNTQNSIDVITSAVLKEGTTSMLATTMTYDLAITKEVISRLSEYKTTGANVLGVHLEGPFISLDYIGAQNPLYVQAPNVEILKMIDVNDFVKLVTYAPEDDKDYSFLNYLNEKNIIGSAGHTNATCECVNDAYKKGLKSITHYHNAMTPHTHRDPGVVTAGLLNKELNVELIVDGVHLHPEVVKTVYTVKGSDNITLITDAMCAKGMEDGEYSLGGQKVIKKGNEARLLNGALAGSVLEMNNAVKNMFNFSNCQIEEAFLMASYNQAQLLNIKNKGLITEGYDCDITILDENFNVVQTIVNGETLYNV